MNEGYYLYSGWRSIMSKRKRVRKEKNKRTLERPDEFVELSFAHMARWGRFISTRGTLSAEEHSVAVDAFLENDVKIRQEQQRRRDRLIEILHKVDSVDLLARASIMYLRIDPDTYKEWESDRSAAHIGYLALQVLDAGLSGPQNIDPMRVTALTVEAIEIVRQMFQSASLLIVMESVTARQNQPDDPTVEYAFKTRLQSLGVRGTGYAEHLTRIIHGCLDPFGHECRKYLGFTATEALALTHGIADLISERIKPRAKESATAYADMLRQLKRERRGREKGTRVFPDWLLEASWPVAQKHLSMSSTVWLFADSRSLALVTPEELSSHCSIDVAACRTFLDAFSCPPELFQLEHHSFPCGAHPLTIQPILRVGDGYLLPVASSMFDAIRPRMEDLLHCHPTLWERYIHARGRYLEQEATSLLTAAFLGGKSWNGIEWKTISDSSDLDGLVTADDFTIRLQCKAGRLTAPARRGAAARMKRDVQELIEAAAKQHRALALALHSEGAKQIGFSDDQADALKAALQFEAIVCLDDVTVWATETHKLRTLGALPEDRHVPWVLALADLMAVVDLLQGAELTHYLLRRQRIERDGRMEAHDELDWVGHYIAEGLFFDRFFEGEEPPHIFRLLSYTDPIDDWYFTKAGLRTVKAPKPSQKIPIRLKELIQRLEREQPRHWILATSALLDGDDPARNAWDKAIGHAHRRIQTEGWSNASQIFNGRLGVTYYIDMRIPSPEIRQHVTEYCTTKAEKHDQPNWIGIGEGATGRLFVTIIERKPSSRMADIFLDPPTVQSDMSTNITDQPSAHPQTKSK